MAQVTMKTMLESPEISQRLLSAFFYYNPLTGETQMMRPANLIGEFINKIQQAVGNPDRDTIEVFKKILLNFQQLNLERSHIVNN